MCIVCKGNVYKLATDQEVCVPVLFFKPKACNPHGLNHILDMPVQVIYVSVLVGIFGNINFNKIIIHCLPNVLTVIVYV